MGIASLSRIGRLMMAVSGAAIALCFFLPWADCPGLQASGWTIPDSIEGVSLAGTPARLPGYVVYLVPLLAVVALLLLRWSRRKIAGACHLLLGTALLLFVIWASISWEALACSRPGLWGTLVGLASMIWGGVKEMRE